MITPKMKLGFRVERFHLTKHMQWNSFELFQE